MFFYPILVSERLLIGLNSVTFLGRKSREIRHEVERLSGVGYLGHYKMSLFDLNIKEVIGLLDIQACLK